MSVADRVNAAIELLGKPGGDYTADEMQTIQTGLLLGRLTEAMTDFKGLLATYPAAALDLVNDFKADPAFQTLTTIMGET